MLSIIITHLSHGCEKALGIKEAGHPENLVGG